MNYKKAKRAPIDKCNICGQVKRLTWDHVPPKSCNNYFSIKVSSLFNGILQDNSYDELFQSGLKFRSLCDDCNNKVLGTIYDPAYNDFIAKTSRVLLSNIALPNKLYVSLEINKVSRAICGHILAAKDFYDNASKIDKSLREYFLDENKKKPNDLYLYFWVYPYSSVLVVRDFTVKSYTGECPNGVLSVISFFPVSIILTTEENRNIGLTDLFSHTTASIGDVIKISIDTQTAYYSVTQKPRDRYWPCNVSANEEGISLLLGNSKNTAMRGMISEKNQAKIKDKLKNK